MHRGDVHLAAGRPIAVSGYLHQVQALAAAEFVGREEELAQLHAFCTEPGPGGYWRWLAPAWAGKSALLAELVLRPPAGTDIAAFFITSRLAGQADAAAFCEVVQRQLYALLGEEEPLCTPHTRDEQFRLALDRAAAHCAEKGRRLVLVVDGLDEDRGVRPGPDCHSIAALLPRTPPHGLRLVLAGRPHPPVPGDVPPGHPLRSTGIDHPLALSAAAQAIRLHAEEDLLRLKEAGGLGWELVGLTVAAGGGLSAPDLAELTDTPRRLVERELSAVDGRSFQWRAGQWDADGPGAYLLAHEEIRRSAEELMPRKELAEHRTRLHHWADGHREAGWPAGTPEYLLRGYGRLLGELGDAERLVELVTNRARQQRLWETTGSDFDALGELGAAMDVLVARSGGAGEAPVAGALRIAVSRDALHDLTSRVPTEVVACWAKFGHVDRAINLAHSHRDPYDRITSLTAVARVLAAGGELPRAHAVADGLDSSADRTRCREGIARGLVDARRFGEARQLARELTDPERRAGALTALLRAMAADRIAVEHPEFAAAVAQDAGAAIAAVEGRGRRMELSAARAGALDLLGDVRGAHEALRRAESVVAAERDGRLRVVWRAGIVRHASGGRALAAALQRIQQAAVTEADLLDPAEAEWSLPDIAEDLARGGFHREARELVDRSELGEEYRDYAYARIARARARNGDLDGAEAALEEIAEPEDTWLVRRAIARRLLRDGRPEEAAAHVREHGNALAPQLASDREVALLLVEMADVLWQAGEEQDTCELVSAAALLARRRAVTTATLRSVASAAATLGRLGHRDDGVRLLRHLRSREELTERQFAGTLHRITLALGLNAVGLAEEAGRLLAEEAELVRQLPHPAERSDALADVAEAFVGIGERGPAERITAELLALMAVTTGPARLVWYRSAAIRACAATGQLDRCLELIEGFDDSWDADVHLHVVVEALAERGELDAAERLVARVRHENEHSNSIAAVVRAAAAAGDLARAEAWLARLESSPRKEHTAPHLAACLADNGRWPAARALADGLKGPADRGRALAMLAARRGPGPEGRRLLVEALALTPWDGIVEEFARAAPELVPLLVDLVLAAAEEDAA
ncbi:hypothetical protein [Kitasatospora cheerisanensis]|uniref:hypothetical protein n=1 Tax=Kitasatospora cheerisanensis TaxID=81942 RepID=UPI0012EE219C|nr:hypothetical protein [Kitasatospora cheerisanensis]